MSKFFPVMMDCQITNASILRTAEIRTVGEDCPTGLVFFPHFSYRRIDKKQQRRVMQALALQNAKIS